MKESVVERIRREKHGFITREDLPDLIKENRFQQCLVRCGGGRFTCSAQDVDHLTHAIRRSGTDYVRDVSLPAARHWEVEGKQYTAEGSRYLAVILNGNLDRITYENPDKAPEALRKVTRRANALREQGHTAYPALIQQIKEA